MGRRVSEVVAVVVAAACGCAAGGPEVGALRTDRVGPPFADLRRVATFRPGARDAARGKDVLDGLAASLAARGMTVVQDLPEEAARVLEDLRRRLELWEGPVLEERGGVVIGVDEDAGRAVRAAGVDAVAFAFRYPRLLVPGPPRPPFGSPRENERRAALGALVLVSSRDEVARVEWGSADGTPLAGPANPAEAIEALLGVLPEGSSSPAEEPVRAR